MKSALIEIPWTKLFLISVASGMSHISLAQTLFLTLSFNIGTIDVFLDILSSFFWCLIAVIKTITSKENTITKTARNGIEMKKTNLYRRSKNNSFDRKEQK